MGGTKLTCIAHDLESRILQPLLSHQREAQKRNNGVDLHLQTADGRGVDLHQVKEAELNSSSLFYDLPQVMVLPRSGTLRSLRVTLVETSLTLLLLLRISYQVSIESRDLEPFHSIEQYRVSNPQY